MSATHHEGPLVIEGALRAYTAVVALSVSCCFAGDHQRSEGEDEAARRIAMVSVHAGEDAAHPAANFQPRRLACFRLLWEELLLAKQVISTSPL